MKKILAKFYDSYKFIASDGEKYLPPFVIHLMLSGAIISTLIIIAALIFGIVNSPIVIIFLFIVFGGGLFSYWKMHGHLKIWKRE